MSKDTAGPIFATTVADLPDADARPATSVLDPKEKNDRRASFAAATLKEYVEITSEPTSTEPAEALGDLLGDLRHLCDAIGHDFDTLAARSASYYEAEVNGE